MKTILKTLNHFVVSQNIVTCDQDFFIQCLQSINSKPTKKPLKKMMTLQGSSQETDSTNNSFTKKKTMSKLTSMTNSSLNPIFELSQSLTKNKSVIMQPQRQLKKSKTEISFPLNEEFKGKRKTKVENKTNKKSGHFSFMPIAEEINSG